MTKITRPTLLLDEKIAKRNIKRMADKARTDNVDLRPHFKTHQSAAIGKWFRNEGVKSITVSSVEMAEYFAAQGWENITIAMPLNVLELEKINLLAKQVHLNLLVVNLEACKHLNKYIDHTIGVYIEIDPGYHRTGILPDQLDLIHQILSEIRQASLTQFRGFYTHAGHSYHARSKEEILSIHTHTLTELQLLKQTFLGDWPKLEIVMGDTPCCSLVDSFEGLDAISPGNFVFYDLTQYFLDVCRLQDIAVAMACPVIATYPQRNQVVIHGGAVHFSKDTVLSPDNEPCFAMVVEEKEGGWGELREDVILSSMSQEHGIITGPDEWMSIYQPGDIVYLLPAHSCLTANLMGEYVTTEGQVVPTMQSKAMVEGD